MGQQQNELIRVHTFCAGVTGGDEFNGIPNPITIT